MIFGNCVETKELGALYEMCCPTPTRVLLQLRSAPDNSLEDKCTYRWPKLYVRNMDTKVAVKFVRFELLGQQLAHAFEF